MLDSVLPEEVWKEAQPVLSIQGEVDWEPHIHDVFIRALHTVSLDKGSSISGPLGSTLTSGGLSSMAATISTPNKTPGLNGIVNVPFRFLSLAKTVVFPPKKPTHPLKAADGRPLEGYTVGGLVKQNWIKKHVSQLPSAAILLAPFDNSWSAAEWGRRELVLWQDMERLRQQVGPRDVRIFVVLIRRAGLPSGMSVGDAAEDARESEERLVAFRRRTPPVFEAGKMVYVLQYPQDLQPSAPGLRRMYKHVRDLSSGYYFLHGKRVKRWESALNRHAQLPLIVRYRFKQAFWYEFMGHAEKALKHFRKTFDALIELQAGWSNLNPSTFTEGPVVRGGAPALGLTTSTSPSASQASALQSSNAHVLGGWVSQIKAVAEVVAFKICYYSMREARHGEALRQFRLLMSTWGWKKQQRVGRAVDGDAGTGRPLITMMPSSSFSSSFSSSSTSTSSPLDGSCSGGLDTTPRGAAGAPSAAPPTEYNRLDFLSYKWTARQNQIFGDLLQLFPCFPSPPSSISNSSSNSSSATAAATIMTYMDPDHYFFNAALEIAKQREMGLFLQANPRPESKLMVRFESHMGSGAGPLLGLPLYMGGRPRLVDSNIENGIGEGDICDLVQLILEREEAAGGEVRREEVLRLLVAAVSVYDPSRPRRPRFKGMQHVRLADELMEAGREREAWGHYCTALKRYERYEKLGLEGGGCGGSVGWSLPTVVMLGRMRVCALRLGGVEKNLGQYLDLTLKLLSQDLRGMVGEETRKLFWEEVLFLVFGIQREERGQQQQQASSLWSSIFTFHEQQQRQPPTNFTSSVSKLGPVTYDDSGEETASSVSTSLEPMLTLLTDTVQVDLNCGWRQLVSFSLCFPDATAAMGCSCLVLLRVVSHLPLPLHVSEMLLRFNKPYIGAVRIVEASSLPASTASALDRIKQSFTAAPALVAPPLQPAVKVDDQNTAHVTLSLLLQPDKPLDIPLTLSLPMGEAVEVGDLLHAVQLQLLINAPNSTSPSFSSSLFSPFPPLRRSLCLNLPSGVAYTDGLGVTRANVFKGPVSAAAATEVYPPSSPATHLSSLPVPLQASLRGFPALEVTRPVAHASLALRTQKEAENRLVTSLVGHLHCLWLKVESNEDTLSNPVLHVRSDPPARSSQLEDAFFFENNSNSSISRRGPTPLKLGKDMQPEAALPVLLPLAPLSSSSTTDAAVLSPQSSVLVPVWVRPKQEGRVKINIVLVYHATASAAVGETDRREDIYSNRLVSYEYVFDLESYAPFVTAFDVASPCPALPPAPSSKIARALQGDTDDKSTADAGAAAAHIFYTGEQVMMRLSIKALHPSSWGESQGGGRPRIEQVVWHPVESGNWAPDRVAAISDKRKEKRNENGEGRVLYSFAQDRHGRRGGGEHDERGMQPHDVLTLTFPFLCPETESSQALSLGHMRLYWRVVSTSSSSFPSSSFSEKPTAATTASPSSSSWLACTEAECPIVGVVAPDIIVHLHAPSDVILGQAFKLRWTLRNLTEKVLTIRVVLKEGGGGNSGPSTEEALVWSGARESVVQILPHESIHLRYRVVAVLTGPIALPRLVLTQMPDAAAVSSSKKEEGGTSLPLRVAYRYVDNVLSNSTLSLSTPRSAENRGSVVGGQPSDTRHLFVIPEAALNQ
ncbi:hypothetical protein VYU27_006473 [Nannochloropsis oceanica]